MWWRTPRYTGPERRKAPRWRPRPIRLLLALLALVVVGYAAIVIWLMTQETRLVFQAGSVLGPARPAFSYAQIELPRADRARQFAWQMPAQAAIDRPWVIFLHGNAASIASRVNIAHYRLLRDEGLAVLAPEYRGFSGLQGTPTEAGLAADARAAYDYVRGLGVPATRIVIYGWSLGSAVAIRLAADAASAGVILEGAPSSIASIGQRQYPFFPIRLVMRNPFDSSSRIGRVRAPLLFLHSPEDAVVPFEEGRKLYDAATAPKVLVEVRGGHVNASEEDSATFRRAIGAFLARTGLGAPLATPSGEPAR